ncbi:MAG: Rne/Rng family ribonuclease [Terriglobales bacterium]
MSKELFVSSTPHETKVAIVEDDQLAEIYFERENEYTLAGSIYKGRVSRVLPGMQSAFVDVGLERDAFLYVSDFFEDQEEYDTIATQAEDAVVKTPGRAAEPVAAAEPQGESSGNAAPAGDGPSGTREPGSRRWRRRRRRGGRGRGRESQDPQSFRPDSGRPEPARSESRRPEPRPQSHPVSRPQPPADYEPMVLPGESISKYRNRASAPQPVSEAPVAVEPTGPASAEAKLIEPREAVAIEAAEAPRLSEAASAGRGSFEIVGGYEEHEPAHEKSTSHPPAAEEREPERAERMNLAATFGGEQAGPEPAPRSSFSPEAEVIEEEIEEEEGELPSLQEELEDAELEEMMEEETLTPGGERAAEAGAGRSAGMSRAEAFAGEEVDFEEDEEDEGSEAGGEESESGLEPHVGEATEAAEGESPERAELRGSSGTAGYMQRTAPAGPGRRLDRGRSGGRGGRAPRGRRNIQRGPRAQIADLLKEGQEILVQIAKEPMGKKGARITSHIALPGRFLVYMPTVDHIGVSRKIASEEERARLRRILLSERNAGAPDAPTTGKGGFIVRTAAAGANEDDLRADIRFLINLWNEIRGRAEQSNAPALLYHDLNVVERILRDQVTETFSHIWVDAEAEYERVLRFVSRFQPSLVKRVKLYTKDTPLFEEFNIQEEINKALKSKVWLKSGGYIVINQTEALVAVDINTGKYVGKTARLEDTIVKTNVDAIKEIVRQIRLRDLGGIIVIDFIDMDERRNRQKVMQALDEALRADRAPTKVLAFNDFGLVAITRKRVKQSLERTLGAQCTYCTGTGLIKSVATVCNEIYVEMRKIYKHLERQGDLMLRTHPEVAKNLKANGARLLGEMEELTGRTIIVKADPTLHQEQFDIN